MAPEGREGSLQGAGGTSPRVSDIAGFGCQTPAGFGCLAPAGLRMPDTMGFGCLTPPGLVRGARHHRVSRCLAPPGLGYLAPAGFGCQTPRVSSCQTPPGFGCQTPADLVRCVRHQWAWGVWHYRAFGCLAPRGLGCQAPPGFEVSGTGLGSLVLGTTLKGETDRRQIFLFGGCYYGDSVYSRYPACGRGGGQGRSHPRVRGSLPPAQGDKPMGNA